MGMPTLRVWGILDVFVLTTVVLLTARSEDVAALTVAERERDVAHVELEGSQRDLRREQRSRELIGGELESERGAVDALRQDLARTREALQQARADADARDARFARELVASQEENRRLRQLVEAGRDGTLQEILAALAQRESEELREAREELERARLRVEEAELQASREGQRADGNQQRIAELEREVARAQERMEALRESNRLLSAAANEDMRSPRAVAANRLMRQMVVVVDVVLRHGDREASVVRIGDDEFSVERFPVLGRSFRRGDERVDTNPAAIREVVGHIEQSLRARVGDNTVLLLSYEGDPSATAQKELRDALVERVGAVFPAAGGRRVVVSDWVAEMPANGGSGDAGDE